MKTWCEAGPERSRRLDKIFSRAQLCFIYRMGTMEDTDNKNNRRRRRRTKINTMVYGDQGASTSKECPFCTFGKGKQKIVFRRIRNGNG